MCIAGAKLGSEFKPGAGLEMPLGTLGSVLEVQPWSRGVHTET